MTSPSCVLTQPQDKAAAGAAERAETEAADAAVARRLHELQLADAKKCPGLLRPSLPASPEDLAAIAAMEAASQAPPAVSGAHTLVGNEQSMQSSLVQHACLACKLRERCSGERLCSAAFAVWNSWHFHPRLTAGSATLEQAAAASLRGGHVMLTTAATSTVTHTLQVSGRYLAWRVLLRGRHRRRCCVPSRHRRATRDRHSTLRSVSSRRPPTTCCTMCGPLKACRCSMSPIVLRLAMSHWLQSAVAERSYHTHAQRYVPICVRKCTTSGHLAVVQDQGRILRSGLLWMHNAVKRVDWHPALTPCRLETRPESAWAGSL